MDQRDHSIFFPSKRSIISITIEWQKDQWQTITRGSDTGLNYNFDNLQCDIHYLSGNNHFVNTWFGHIEN